MTPRSGEVRDIARRLSLDEVVGTSTGVVRPDMKRRLDSIIIGGAMLFGGMAHRQRVHCLDHLLLPIHSMKLFSLIPQSILMQYNGLVSL